MGFRVAKSFKIAKGVRVNVSKRGIGMSVGAKGMRQSVHSSGRRTTTVGIPGSGVRYQTSRGGSGRWSSAPSRSAPPTVSPQRMKPGLLAPKGEKALYKAVQLTADDLIKVGEEHPDRRLVAYSVAGFRRVAQGKYEEAKKLLKEAFDLGNDLENDPFVRKYLAGTSRMTVGIAEGVEAELPFSRDGVGLMLAELYQEEDDLKAAIDVVERLDPSTYAALSLAELYQLAGEYDEVVRLTERISNEDDVTALLLVYRAMALRDKGMNDAAAEAFKEALKSRSRAREIRHLALWERSRLYESIGKRAQARKDLEKILAEDSTYEGLKDRLEKLGL